MTFAVTFLIFKDIRDSITIAVNLAGSDSRFTDHISSTYIVLISLNIDILLYKSGYHTHLVDIFKHVVTIIHAAGIYTDCAIIKYTPKK